MTERDAGAPGELRIAPSILSADFGDLGNAVEEVDHETDWLHVDIMDGHFVPNISIGPPVVTSLRTLQCSILRLSPHDQRAEPLLRGLQASGCGRLHRSRGGWRDGLVTSTRPGRSGCASASPPTPTPPLKRSRRFSVTSTCCSLMTVFPGFGGQSFIANVMDKVEQARYEIDRRALALDLEVDGGIDVTTAPVAVAAGANVLVAGSAIFGQRRSPRRGPDAARRGVQHAPMKFSTHRADVDGDGRGASALASTRHRTRGSGASSSTTAASSSARVTPRRRASRTPRSRRFAERATPRADRRWSSPSSRARTSVAPDPVRKRSSKRASLESWWA